MTFFCFYLWLLKVVFLNQMMRDMKAHMLFFSFLFPQGSVAGYKTHILPLIEKEAYNITSTAATRCFLLFGSLAHYVGSAILICTFVILMG